MFDNKEAAVRFARREWHYIRIEQQVDMLGLEVVQIGDKWAVILSPDRIGCPEEEG